MEPREIPKERRLKNKMRWETTKRGQYWKAFTPGYLGGGPSVVTPVAARRTPVRSQLSNGIRHSGGTSLFPFPSWQRNCPSELRRAISWRSWTAKKSELLNLRRFGWVLTKQLYFCTAWKNRSICWTYTKTRRFELLLYNHLRDLDWHNNCCIIETIHKKSEDLLGTWNVG